MYVLTIEGASINQVSINWPITSISMTTYSLGKYIRMLVDIQYESTNLTKQTERNNKYFKVHQQLNKIMLAISKKA